MIKVANIIEESRFGGPQNRILQVAKVLKKMRIETIVILPKVDSSIFHERLVSNRINNHRININRLTKSIFGLSKYIIFFIYEVFLLYKYLSKNKFKLIHISGGAWQIKGVLAGYLSKTKILWHLNDTNMPIIVRSLFKLISQNVDGFIFASHRTKNYYHKFLPKAKLSFIIPAPVDTKLFSLNNKIDVNNQVAKMWDGKIVVGTVANVNPIKNLDLFIELAINNKTNIKNLQFVIIGAIFPSQNNYYKSLLKKIKKIILKMYYLWGSRKISALF